MECFSFLPLSQTKSLIVIAARLLDSSRMSIRATTRSYPSGPSKIRLLLESSKLPSRPLPAILALNVLQRATFFFQKHLTMHPTRLVILFSLSIPGVMGCDSFKGLVADLNGKAKATQIFFGRDCREFSGRAIRISRPCTTTTTPR